MRIARAAACALLTIATAAGCASSGSESDTKAGAPEAPGSDKAVAKLSVPSAYDRARGWDETLHWVPQTVTTLPATGAPRTQGVAMMYAASEGYTLKMRSVNDGAVQWTSEPWNPPAQLEGAEGDPQSGEAAEIPDVTTVTQGGHEYVVAYAHGMRGKSELREGTEVVRLALYPADASGSSVKPVRQIDVPVSADVGEVTVNAQGGRLLVAWGQGGPYPQWSAAVDVTTGKVTPYKDADKLLPQCEKATMCDGSRVMAATADGPLVEMGDGGFGMPGHWFSNQVRPDGVSQRTGFMNQWNGAVYGVTDGRLLAEWKTGGEYSDESSVWSVHNIRTGALQAGMACQYDGGHHNVTDDSSDREYPVVTSPNGRYLAAGPIAFDLKRKKGTCFEGNGDRKTIAIGSIRNDGTAYGAVIEDGNKPPTGEEKPVIAQVNLGTAGSRPKALGVGTEVPVIDLLGHGVFLTRDKDKNLRVSVRHER
ncbi:MULTISPECIES: hypothetical protein [Streptomyces]|uniref:hypothetical protein n=1 Tax=Streptomyces TaxID=1883 RepID=UPI00131BB683|nr:hypothetical protein [Streptomyces sp. NRRL S-1868]